MSKRIALLLFILLLTLLLTGCKATGTNMIRKQLENIPNMTVIYTTNGERNELSLSPGAPYSWGISYGDGTGVGMHADADHPLNETRYLKVIERSADTTVLEIGFSTAPESYTIQRWRDIYIGKYAEHMDDFEWLDVSDNKVVLSDDNQGYFYVVVANWSQGYAHFPFHVK